MRWLLSVLAFLSLSLPPALAAPRPTEGFALLETITAPRLSPDGNKVALTVGVNARTFLIIQPVYKGQGEKRVLEVGDDDLNGYQWVGNDWLLVGLIGETRVRSEPMQFTRVVAFNVNTGKSEILAKNDASGRADDVLWVSSDGPPRVLLAFQASIFEGIAFWPQVRMYELGTGRSRAAVQSRKGVMNWYADRDGVVRMGFDYSDASGVMRLLYRDTEQESFKVIREADTKNDEDIAPPATFAVDDQPALTVSDTSGFYALYQFDARTGTLGEKIFDTPGYDIDGPRVDAASHRLIGVDYTSDRARVHWVDADLKKIQEELEKSVPGQVVQIVSMDSARVRFIVHISRIGSPGSFYLFERAEGLMQRLGIVNEKLGTGALAPVRMVRYRARDGLEIEAVLTMPPGRADAKGLPLIMMPHGGPRARDDLGWDYWAQFLADRGYAVLQPNFRGSTGYGTAFMEAGEGEWGLKMQDDVDDARAWAVKEGIADAGRVCIAGGSYGGYTAMRAAQRNSDLYRCAISFAGVSDMPRLIRYDQRFLYGNSAKRFFKEQAPDLEAISPYRAPQTISIPVLLIHGKKDKRVPFNQSEIMANAMRSAGKPVTLIDQPEGDHHLSRGEDRLQFLVEMEKFLTAHNPAG